MEDVVIVSGCRTAIGAFGGTLLPMNGASLAAVTMGAFKQTARKFHRISHKPFSFKAFVRILTSQFHPVFGPRILGDAEPIGLTNGSPEKSNYSKAVKNGPPSKEKNSCGQNPTNN